MDDVRCCVTPYWCVQTVEGNVERVETNGRTNMVGFSRNKCKVNGVTIFQRKDQGNYKGDDSIGGRVV